MNHLLRMHGSPDCDAPDDLATEQAMIGAIFLDPEAYQERVAPWFVPEWMQFPPHMSIMKAVQTLCRQGIAPDLIAVHDHLVSTQQIALVGGRDYLESICRYAAQSWHLETYARIIQEHALRRAIADVGQQITRMAADYSRSTPSILAWIGEAALRLQGQNPAMMTSIGAIIDDALNDIAHMPSIAVIPSGLPLLDRLTGGLTPGSMVILAARPGVGKSAFAGFVALNAALSGVPTAIFSLEMTAKQIMKRMIAATCNIDLHKVRTSSRSIDIDAIRQKTNELRDLPLFIDDTQTSGIADLHLRTITLINQGVRLIIVDYLQLLSASSHPTREQRNRVMEITEITRTIASIARTNNVVMLALSQLTRDIERRTDPTPRLSDLRESGSIEQDADMVWFLHPQDSPSDISISRLNLVVAKNRHGPTGTVPLQMDRSHFRFWEDLKQSNHRSK